MEQGRNRKPVLVEHRTHSSAEARNAANFERRVRSVATYGTAIGVTVFATFFALGLVDPTSAALKLGREDGVVEYLGAAFWAAASIVCVTRLARGQLARAALLVFWGLFTFVCMGEEVSWFQRVFGVETPESIREVNVQGEINLHNLAVSFDTQYVFLFGFVCWFLFLPLLTNLKRVRSLAGRVGYVAPGPAFLVMIWGVTAASYALQAVGSDAAVRVIAESRETFFAFVVLAYVALYLGPSAPAPQET